MWPHKDYRLIEVGMMELNRWPDNYFAEVEQAAFGPSNIVPGISFSPDRMLQARLFSYNDAVRYRLGVGQVLDSLLRAEMEFDPDALVRRIDHREGVATKEVHMAEALRDAAVRHDDRNLVQRVR